MAETSTQSFSDPLLWLLLRQLTSTQLLSVPELQVLFRHLTSTQLFSEPELKLLLRHPPRVIKGAFRPVILARQVGEKHPGFSRIERHLGYLREKCVEGGDVLGVFEEHPGHRAVNARSCTK